MKNIPKDLADLLHTIATDFPGILRDNLVGAYLWGSLTYEAFDETCSDVDFIVVTRRDLDHREFSELDDWFKKTGEHNRWVKRVDMRFVIDKEFLDKTSRCCGFYHYTGKMIRTGSDGNPIIWVNIGQCGITLWGENAKLIAPQVSEQCLIDGLTLEFQGPSLWVGDEESSTDLAPGHSCRQRESLEESRLDDTAVGTGCDGLRGVRDCGGRARAEATKSLMSPCCA